MITHDLSQCLSRSWVEQVMMCKLKWLLSKINASIHHGKLLKRLATQEDLQILFLLPYNPELAPIESVFATIKAKMKRTISKETCNFKKNEGKRKIIDALSEISKTTIHKIWIRVIQVAKSFIIRNISAEILPVMG